MGGATAGQRVLSCVGKQAEQAMDAKPGNSVPLWSLLEFLPSLPSAMDRDPDVETK